MGPEITPLQPFPGRFREFEGVYVATHHRMNKLKGALGWSLSGIALAYILFAAAVGVIAR